jgi:hypothetical protein
MDYRNTVILESGANGRLSFVLCKNRDVYNYFIDLHQQNGIGTSYGPNCGWQEANSIPGNLTIKLLTLPILNKIVLKGLEEDMPFDYILASRKYIVEDTTEDDDFIKQYGDFGP